MELILLKYKNYADRKVLYGDVTADPNRYIDKVSKYKRIPGVLDFDYGDGVETKKYVNITEDWGVFPYDYCLVCDAEETVTSHWYIMEAKYVRKGGFWLTLRRDIIADNLPSLNDSPSIILKAQLEDSSPLVFNKEGVSYNQIKTDEIQLPDESECNWVVGFIPRDFTGKVTINYTTVNADMVYDSEDDMKKADWYQYVGQTRYKTSDVTIAWRASASLGPGGGGYNTYHIEEEHFRAGKWDKEYPAENIPPYKGSTWIRWSNGSTQTNMAFPVLASITTPVPMRANIIANQLQSIAYDNAQSYVDETYSNDGYDRMIALGNSIIKAGSKYYQIKYVRSSEYSEDSAPGNVQAYMRSAVQKAYADGQGSYGDNSTFVCFKKESVSITLEEVNLVAHVNITDDRPHLLDTSLYDMFCMPVNLSGKYSVIYEAGGKTVKQDGLMSLAMASGITASAGDKSVYDVQLLPYCPIRDTIRGGSITVVGKSFFRIYDGDDESTAKVIGVMVFAQQSNFHFDIDMTIPEIGRMNTRKESNELETWRLCSPNYNGLYEFSPAKNGGVTGFHVDCTYKPFQSYIKISPKFGGLYGKDFEDRRGLILGGDFSLPRLTTEWANYVQNNKNYQASFDRQIESLELKQRIGMQSQIMSAIAGTAQGGVQGAIAGSAGGPAGAIAGAVIGTAASAVGGVIDTLNQKALYEDEVSKQKALFQYSLQNVQAIPESISKASSFDLNVKPFPYIEYYRPTDVEIQAFRDMIKWNGMTVGVVGYPIDYRKDDETYLEASVIRLSDSFTGDAHEAEAFKFELRKGVYI